VRRDSNPCERWRGRLSAWAPLTRSCSCNRLRAVREIAICRSFATQPTGHDWARKSVLASDWTTDSAYLQALQRRERRDSNPTSGVTDRYELNRHSRLQPGITCWSRHFLPERTGCDRLRRAAARQGLCSRCVVAVVPTSTTAPTFGFDELNASISSLPCAPIENWSQPVARFCVVLAVSALSRLPLIGHRLQPPGSIKRSGLPAAPDPRAPPADQRARRSSPSSRPLRPPSLIAVTDRIAMGATPRRDLRTTMRNRAKLRKCSRQSGAS
jgi:hypothetical protein